MMPIYRDSDTGTSHATRHPADVAKFLTDLTAEVVKLIQERDKAFSGGQIFWAGNLEDEIRTSIEESAYEYVKSSEKEREPVGKHERAAREYDYSRHQS